jgi:DNA-binding transcriptional LysR family regulator
MHIETLKIFIDLSRSGSFSIAGRRNSISQSAVSQQIMCLERKLGVTLLVRGGRSGVELTPEGIVFLAGCEQILECYSNILSELDVVREGFLGEIHLALEPCLNRFWLSDPLEGFRKRRPELLVHVVVDQYEGVYAKVLSGEADMGLVVYPTRRSGLHVDVLKSEEMALLSASAHSQGRKDPFAWSDLEGERFVAYASNEEMREEIKRQFALRGSEFRPALEFQQADHAKSAILNEGGVTFLPKAVASNELRSGTLRFVPISPPLAPVPLGVVSRLTMRRSAGFRIFLEWLQSWES